jgi:hypothetical protein
MDLSVHIILSEDASSLLQATYPSSHLNCSAVGPSFERFFILGGPRGTRQKKTSKYGLNVSAHIQPNISSTEVMQSSFLLIVTNNTDP